MDKICCFNCFSKNGTVQEMLCEPCISENLKVPASSFCKSCEDPKPLCDICAKHHTKQKLSRNQVLCRDIKAFGKRYLFIKWISTYFKFYSA